MSKDRSARQAERREEERDADRDDRGPDKYAERPLRPSHWDGSLREFSVIPVQANPDEGLKARPR